MSDREDLMALRRMAELQAKADAAAAPATKEPSLMDSALFNNPITGAGELALQGVSGALSLLPQSAAGISGMLSGGRAGMKQTAKDIQNADITYQPRTDSARLVNKGLGKAMDVLHQVALARAEGPNNINGESPLMLGRFGMHVPVPESPAASEAVGAALDLAPQAAAAFTPARALGRTLGKAGSAVSGAFSPTVQATRVIQELAGTPEQRAAQAAALRGPGGLTLQTPVKNSGPTAAQMLVDVPEGTTLQALQDEVSRNPAKGISIDFSRRWAAQKAAIEQAKLEREAATAPLREQGLGKATDINRAGLNADVGQAVNGPWSDVDTTRNFLTRLQSDIANARNPAGLYAIRKQINDLLSSKMESDKVVTRGATVPLTSMREAIDKAITEGGAGDTWKQYLNQYAEHSKPITALGDQTERMYSPDQPTSLGTAGTIPNDVHAPHLVNRNAALVNYSLGLRKTLLAKGVNRKIADVLLDPNALADILSPKPPPAPVPPLTLVPPPGRAYEPHQPQILRPDASGVTAAESSQVPQDNLNLQPPPGPRLGPSRGPGPSERETTFDPNQQGLDFGPADQPTPPASGPTGPQSPLNLPPGGFPGHPEIPRPAEVLPPISSTVTRARQKAEMDHLMQVLAARLREQQ
jgi:hypothetical protein